jgi:hypothetical protein
MAFEWGLYFLGRRILHVARSSQEAHHTVAVLEQLLVAPKLWHAQGVAFGVAQHEQAAGLKELRQIYLVEQLLGKRS